MRIISTFLPAEPDEIAEGRQALLMAFDTLVEDKSLVVGFTVGSMTGRNIADVRVSAPGQAIIDRCSTHHRLNYPGGDVVVAGIAKVAGAKERVRKALADAPPKSLVLLLAADNKVYDAAFEALGIDFKSANQDAQ